MVNVRSGPTTSADDRDPRDDVADQRWERDGSGDRAGDGFAHIEEFLERWSQVPVPQPPPDLIDRVHLLARREVFLRRRRRRNRAVAVGAVGALVGIATLGVLLSPKPGGPSELATPSTPHAARPNLTNLVGSSINLAPEPCLRALGVLGSVVLGSGPVPDAGYGPDAIALLLREPTQIIALIVNPACFDGDPASRLAQYPVN